MPHTQITLLTQKDLYSFIFLVGEIEALHAEYVDKLEELYKEYNQQYGDTNIKLQIIWLWYLIIKATLQMIVYVCMSFYLYCCYSFPSHIYFLFLAT